MPDNPRDVILRLNAQDQRFMERLEGTLARELGNAYAAARREILSRIEERRRRLAQAGAFSTAAEEVARQRLQRALARDTALFQQIDVRMRVLRGDVAEVVRSQQGRAVQAGQQVAREEVEVVRRGLGVRRLGFTFDVINFDTAEIGLEEALAALLQDQAAVAQALTSGLRLGLLQGESFDQLLDRLLAEEGSIWARGPLSALLGARRTVITAENAARDALYQSYARAIPGLQKQALAVISPQTTECCLRVHGQIQPVERPYALTGEPRFSDEMMYPAFHWNCRTASVAYHAEFEEGAALPTRAMVAQAQGELARRAAAR